MNIDPRQVREVIHLIADGRQAKTADAAIIDDLVSLGIPREHAPDILEQVTVALRKGVSAALLGHDVSSSDESSIFYKEAFGEGRRRFQSAIGMSTSSKVAIVLILVLAAVIAYVTFGR